MKKAGTRIEVEEKEELFNVSVVVDTIL